MPVSRRTFLHRTLAKSVAAAALPLTGCGLLLHPERNGRPHSGRLDPSIVILDAVGCIFFLVPGLIAFIVDFSTGTIYLPPDSYGQADQPVAPESLVAVKTDSETLTRQQIEQIVHEQTGQAVDLDAPDVRARRLERLDEYETAAIELARAEYPAASRMAFER